jgi:hypothetical protein
MDTKNYRVDFKSPDSAGRMHKVFTWALAENEEEAKRKILKHHPGSQILKVEEQPR